MDALDASHFDELTPQERAVLRLTHERLEQGEIARELGATVDVVKKRATAARRKLGAPSTIVAARLLAATRRSPALRVPARRVPWTP